MTETSLPSWFFSSVFIEGPVTLADQCTDAMVVELLTNGHESITMRTIATRIRCDPSTLHHAFGGRIGFRDAVISQFASRYANWLRGTHNGELVRLPLDADELHAVRVWNAVYELAAGAERSGYVAPIEAVAAAEAVEADLLAWRLDIATTALTPVAVAALLATARAVRSAMAHPVDPLPRSVALAIVEGVRSQFIH